MVPKDDLVYMEFTMQHVEAITATAGIEAAKPTGLRSAQIGYYVSEGFCRLRRDARFFAADRSSASHALLQAARRSYSSAFLSMAALASGSSSRCAVRRASCACRRQYSEWLKCEGIAT